MNRADMKKTLHDLSLQRASIQHQLACGIINDVDASVEEEIIMTKERKIKEQLVAGVHVTKDGQPRKIEYKDGKGLWTTMLPNKKKIYAKTKDILIDKLFGFYGLAINDVSISGIFASALKEKADGDNVNERTITHLDYAYQRFITNEFSKRDIRELTKADLKAYTQDLVTCLHPKAKAFLEYKSVLNLIFGYALEYDIIDTNPVLAICNEKYLKSCDCTKPKSADKILSMADIEKVKTEVRHRMAQAKYCGYFINGYAILLSIETGMRVGELCALRWDDIEETTIHIHAQQLSRKGEHGKEYYYAPWTKDEKGISRDGRIFPLTDTLAKLLHELKELQAGKGINSEYVLCHEDGEWIKTDAYQTCLRRLMRSLGFTVTNNHTFRMSLNSNVLAPLGLTPADRARLLGHSEETNQKYYTFARLDSTDEIRELLNSFNNPASTPNVIPFKQVSPRSHQSVDNSGIKKA